MSTLSLTRGSQSRAHSIIQAPKLCVLHLAPLQLDKSQGFHDDFSVQIFRLHGRNFDQTRGEENRHNVEMKGERGEQELCPVTMMAKAFLVVWAYASKMAKNFNTMELGLN